MAMSRRDVRSLHTTADVIEALGGLRAVAGLTGAAYKLVSGWGRAKNFPSRYFLVMTWALQKKRLRAHPSLWGQVTIPEMKQAAA
jgi:hypothetical protein